MPEFKILNHVLEYMEEKGETYKTVSVTIDEELVQEINKSHRSTYTLSDLQSAADKCLANEWLERVMLSSSEYADLGVTPKGLGVAKSRRKSEEEKASRSFLKKASDGIEDHKGLLVFIGSLITIATFVLKFFGDKIYG